ncbi:hypothetical protein QFC20_006050 [Naganishia adeliensis]|uniref:Uncharacterized protein n=1 Tax=Naganishia adeliensis TaxID=92952 RepID=A0ACC2VF34_9TREE|nr:hypothetical protein QFC20_006050 [Naganishia adeliensis]
MGLTISFILKHQREIIAKVEDGDYLEKLVNENFSVLQEVRDKNPGAKIDDPESESDLEGLLNDDEKLAWTQLSRLGKTPIFFSASKYIAYRPLSSGLTVEEACSFMQKEFQRWLNMNRVHDSLRSYSKKHLGRPNDNLSGAVASKLFIDTVDHEASVKTARETADRSCPIYLSKLDLNINNEQLESMVEDCYRWQSAPHVRPGQSTSERAIDDNDAFEGRKGAYKSMTWLLSTCNFVVPFERRPEWLEEWQHSIQANTAESDCAAKSAPLGPPLKQLLLTPLTMYEGYSRPQRSLPEVDDYAVVILYFI